MVVRVQAASLWGASAQDLAVEVFRSAGLPGVALVGLARGATRESWVRVRAALGQLGVNVTSLHLTVNLVPADRPKDASTLELALAVAVMAAAGRLPAEALAGRRFWGEVGLDGRLIASPGALLVADLAAAQGDAEVLVPACNGADAARVRGVRVVGPKNLAEVLAHLGGEEVLPAILPPKTLHAAACLRPEPCLSDIVGQTSAKRAVEVAAAGGHNLLLIGPPGSGKTLLARALRHLLPPLGPAAQAEVLRVRAAASGHHAAPQDHAPELAPFRSPHHTSSAVSLLGGGSQVRPGEVTLAHRGVLFLDELPEFDRRALEALREPLEEGVVHVARAKASVDYPARVMLVAAMNPCPCGHYVPPEKLSPVPEGPRPAPGGAQPPRCLCAFERVQRYRARVSAPLLERIDLQVQVAAVSYAALQAGRHAAAETTSVVRQRVLAARARQAKRLGPGRCNAEMLAGEVQRHVPLDASGQACIQAAMARGRLSMRSLARLCKIARTLADLQQVDGVDVTHLREALTWVHGG